MLERAISYFLHNIAPQIDIDTIQEILNDVNYARSMDAYIIAFIKYSLIQTILTSYFFVKSNIERSDKELIIMMGT